MTYYEALIQVSGDSELILSMDAILPRQSTKLICGLMRRGTESYEKHWQLDPSGHHRLLQCERLGTDCDPYLFAK